MRFDKEVKRDLCFMAAGCAVCSVLTAVVFLILGKFDLSVALGCVIGWLLSFGNFFFMSVGIIMALETGDELTAKRKMRSSYLARTVIMLGVVALALVFPQVHWIPVVLSVFFTRILVTVKNFWDFFRHKNDPIPETAAENTEPDDGEEENTDEFEKFVKGFAKSPAPGENDQNVK